MIIKVRAFGIAKEILSGSISEVELDANCQVGEVRAKLLSTYPQFHKLASLRFAVNTEYVGDEYKLASGDEVVLIPPVSGG